MTIRGTRQAKMARVPEDTCLAAADWLEDNGHPKYAERIRLDVKRDTNYYQAHISLEKFLDAILKRIPEKLQPALHLVGYHTDAAGWVQPFVPHQPWSQLQSKFKHE